MSRLLQSEFDWKQLLFTSVLFFFSFTWPRQTTSCTQVSPRLWSASTQLLHAWTGFIPHSPTPTGSSSHPTPRPFSEKHLLLQARKAQKEATRDLTRSFTTGLMPISLSARSSSEDPAEAEEEGPLGMDSARQVDSPRSPQEEQGVLDFD